MKFLVLIIIQIVLSMESLANKLEVVTHRIQNDIRDESWKH